MSYSQLLKIQKPFFSLDDVAYTLGIQPASAAVLCSRYVKKGFLVRLKRGLYARAEQLANFSQQDLFRLANFLQVPSYISLTTALSYHGLTTQVQRGFFESISLKRTRKFEVAQHTFHYSKISLDLYKGFERVEDVFIALPEKALLDSFYLASLGRYSLDSSALDLTKIKGEVLENLSLLFPPRVKKHMENCCGEISYS
jgi:predicted transcriptional regulator of viral defense system